MNKIITGYYKSRHPHERQPGARDNGPLTAVQLKRIRQLAPRGTQRSIRSSLIETDAAEER